MLSIIRELEAQSLPYAIARNYENYPDFGHDLDLYFDSSAESFEMVAKIVAAKYDWDLVTRCDHWSKSDVRTHNIDVFFFYKLDSKEVLQVDLFQGVLIWGVPLISASTIIRARERHESDLFYRPNLTHENIFRALQIARLSTYSDQGKKVSRYRHRLLCYMKENQSVFYNTLHDLHLQVHCATFQALKVKNFPRFRKGFLYAKLLFILKFAFNKPKIFLYCLYSRLLDYYRFFHKAPCGLKICIETSSEKQRNYVRGSLNEFMKLNLISGWREKDTRWCTNWQERKVLERAGVLVEWLNANNKKSDLIIVTGTSYNKVRSLLLRRIICRHTAVFHSLEFFSEN